MKGFRCLSALALLASGIEAAILWDGRFNDMSSSTELNNWSWGNQVGPYQYYIHGSGPVTEYVNLSPSYKNPSDTGSSKGVKITLTGTSFWNGQNMRRTELIPQTSAAIASGKVYYHFSMRRSATNPPATTREHQIAFFESHFTEMKYGWLSGASGTSDPTLRWMVSGQTKWSTTWDADVWHNMVYEIDFSANTVGFWHSTGANALTRVVSPVSASTSSNGQDWHLGVLELPRSGYADETEDFYFSGVYVESGDVTTSVSGPGSNPGNPDITTTQPTTTTTRTTTTAPPSTTVVPPTTTTTTTPVTTTTTPPAAGGAQHWAQCGGSGFNGATGCVAPYTCSTINPWYAQCL